MTKVRAIAVSIAVVLGLAVIPASPAAAHETSVNIGSGLSKRGSAWISEFHYEWRVCDTRNDGWGVRAYYLLENGVMKMKADGNGSAWPCGSGDFDAVKAVGFYACAGPNGADTVCTEWRVA